ncbi:putative uncharacterized protein DDB_G0290521 [Cynara cardunculus var. scolymus]|uniref:putative uncharacterized protein DDB_G0290521 n=1 Tax=Cynara cardunculus var. scolymus TaxID=59895 RepID=UPI000D62B112|nr:putative uncharacterized protein DDB_G0290521 [Cynara cardunculus var. scolymus]
MPPPPSTSTSDFATKANLQALSRALVSSFNEISAKFIHRAITPTQALTRSMADEQRRTSSLLKTMEANRRQAALQTYLRSFRDAKKKKRSPASCSSSRPPKRQRHDEQDSNDQGLGPREGETTAAAQPAPAQQEHPQPTSPQPSSPQPSPTPQATQAREPEIIFYDVQPITQVPFSTSQDPIVLSSSSDEETQPEPQPSTQTQTQPQPQPSTQTETQTQPQPSSPQPEPSQPQQTDQPTSPTNQPTSPEPTNQQPTNEPQTTQTTTMQPTDIPSSSRHPPQGLVDEIIQSMESMR